MFTHRHILIAATMSAMLVLGLLLPLVLTHQRMAGFYIQLKPGTKVAEVLSYAGQPRIILYQGQKLEAARRTYRLPTLDQNTSLYFYPKEGIPYFNVYVYIDERLGTVTRCDIENLWW
jgi:hypothetical protein